MKKSKTKSKPILKRNYNKLMSNISGLINESRSYTVKAVNSVLTITYWHIGKMIVEYEQKGKERAEYGKQVIAKLSIDLNEKFSRGFTERNLRKMRKFYIYWPTLFIFDEKQKVPPVRAEFQLLEKWYSVSTKLSWTHYRTLININDNDKRNFYEKEAIRGGWSVRQLERQINSQFYERALLSKK